MRSQRRVSCTVTISAAELDAILAAEPGLAAINEGVRQRSWKEVGE